MAMRGRRPRNLDTEKFVAQQHARYLQEHGEEGVNLLLRQIDAKGGDYYRRELYPDQGVVKQAAEDFDGYRMGTPAMEELARDMRRYYGLPKQMGDLTPAAAPLPTSSPNPAPAPAPMRAPVQEIVEQPTMMEKVTNDLVEQQQVASAEQMRQDFVDDISGGVQSRIDQAIEDLKPKGFVLDDPIADIALLTGGSLLAGGGIGAAISGNDDEEMLKKAKELGIIT